MSARARHALPLAACVLAGACATQPPAPGAAPARLAALAAFERWEVRGRVLLRAAGRSDNLGFQWRQDGELGHLHLFGPANWGSYRISSRDGFASFELGRGFERLAPARRAELRQRLRGLPLAHLAGWLLGLCGDGRGESARYAESGETASCRHGGWRVDYLDHRPQGGLPLPRKLSFSGPDSSGRLVLRHWRLER